MSEVKIRKAEPNDIGAIVELCALYAEELNCTHVQWQTPKTNMGSIEFYKKCGASSKDKVRFFLTV